MLIGDLERLQTLLAARLMREAWQAPPGTRSNTALEDPQHLTPARVADLLNLTVRISVMLNTQIARW